MVKNYFAMLPGLTRRYRISAAILVVTLLVCGTTVTVLWTNAEKSIKASEASYQSTTEKTEKLLAQLETKKKAELKAEKERVAKEAEAVEAAAKKAEEEKKPATTTPTSGGGTVSSCNTSTSHNNPVSIDVIVNKKHCLAPLSFVPPDLTTSNGATLSAKAIDTFNQMFATAAAAGQPFTVTSSYRSYDTQISTYNYWVSVNGQQGADTVSARPGFSEHQTGLVIDVGANGCNLDCFGGTSQYQWFQANAANYGFIQRYYAGYEGITGYAGEEWHYRYVGIAVAQDMKVKGIKTLEQYWGIEGGNYN